MKELLLVMTMAILLLNCSNDESKVQSPSLASLQKIYDNAGGKGDAAAITIEDLKATGVENLVATKLSGYQTAIAVKMDFSEPAKVGEVQVLVINVNNICSYESIILNPFEYKTITKEELLGGWKLEAYIFTDDCRIDLTPSNPITDTFFRGPVTINFHEDDSISGHSPSNALSGEYSFEGNKASILVSNATDVNEPNWTDTFYSVMDYYKEEYVTISNDKLIIHSTSEKAVLVFVKI